MNVCYNRLHSDRACYGKYNSAVYAYHSGLMYAFSPLLWPFLHQHDQLRKAISQMSVSPSTFSFSWAVYVSCQITIFVGLLCSSTVDFRFSVFFECHFTTQIRDLRNSSEQIYASHKIVQDVFQFIVRRCTAIQLKLHEVAMLVYRFT